MTRSSRAANRAALQLLVEFWLEGMQVRAINPLSVLIGYRALARPLGLLQSDGTVAEATDAEILAAAAGWEGQWVNLVIGARSKSRVRRWRR